MVRELSTTEFHHCPRQTASRCTRRPFPRFLVAMLFFLLLSSGCATSPRVVIAPGFQPAPDQGVIHVVPFVATLVPHDFSETLFNTFVDDLNGNREGTGVRWYYITKEDMKNIDPAWLGKQVYVTGEVWGYVEEAGCCSAELRVKGRIKLFEPGKTAPSVEIYIPIEQFFEYTNSTIEAERQSLALRLADEMAEKLISALRKRS